MLNMLLCEVHHSSVSSGKVNNGWFSKSIPLYQSFSNRVSRKLSVSENIFKGSARKSRKDS